jgi:hypothetical protein
MSKTIRRNRAFREMIGLGFGGAVCIDKSSVNSFGM